MNAKESFFNVPNVLTLIRFLSLAFVIALFRLQVYWAASAIFLFAMLTDCFDGWIAEKRGERTRIGTYLDPAVDKILILALFYELAHAEVIDPLPCHLFLARELLQNSVRAGASGTGRTVGANWMGKTKAVLQTLLLVWGLLIPELEPVTSSAAQRTIETAFVLSTWAVVVVAWLFFAIFLSWNLSFFTRSEES